jgi:hypothetical protein
VWRDGVRAVGSGDVTPGGCPRGGGRSSGHQMTQVMSALPREWGKEVCGGAGRGRCSRIR